jgi:hypothetical protein
VVVAIATWLISVAVGPAHGQTPAEISGGMINLGGRGWSPGEGKLVTSDRSASQFEFDVRAGIASDYMYRERRYPITNRRSVPPWKRRLPNSTLASRWLVSSWATQPAAEITVSGGVRPKIGDIDFDLRATYYLYPGEVGTTNGIDYWEAGIRADKQITESIRVAGAFAYSPNVSNTGAWSWYAAAGLVASDAERSAAARHRRSRSRRRRLLLVR